MYVLPSRSPRYDRCQPLSRETPINRATSRVARGAALAGQGRSLPCRLLYKLLHFSFYRLSAQVQWGNRQDFKLPCFCQVRLDNYEFIIVG